MQIGLLCCPRIVTVGLESEDPVPDQILQLCVLHLGLRLLCSLKLSEPAVSQPGDGYTSPQYLRLPLCVCLVLKDPDSNPYSLLDNTESDQTVDTDASESHHSSNRRRRSRRRRTDEDAVLMDGMTESDTASVNENGLGM